MLSSSVYLVVCENFVSPGLLYNLPEILSFKKLQNLNIFQCRFGCSRVPPLKKRKERSLNKTNTISTYTSPSYAYVESLSQFCDVHCSTFCMVFSCFPQCSFSVLFLCSIHDFVTFHFFRLHFMVFKAFHWPHSGPWADALRKLVAKSSSPAFTKAIFPN